MPDSGTISPGLYACAMIVFSQNLISVLALPAWVQLQGLVFALTRGRVGIAVIRPFASAFDDYAAGRPHSSGTPALRRPTKKVASRSSRIAGTARSRALIAAMLEYASPPN